MDRFDSFIDGEAAALAGGSYMDVVDAAAGAVYAAVADSDERDVARALPTPIVVELKGIAAVRRGP